MSALEQKTIDLSATVTITRKCSTCGSGDPRYFGKTGEVANNCRKCGASHSSEVMNASLEGKPIWLEMQPCGHRWIDLNEWDVVCPECNKDGEARRPGWVIEYITLEALFQAFKERLRV